MAVACLVEDYVKDLYRIGLILFLAPLVVGIVLTIIGQTISFEDPSVNIGFYTPILAGLIIMLYIAVKYYYKEGRYGKS